MKLGRLNQIGVAPLVIASEARQTAVWTEEIEGDDS